MNLLIKISLTNKLKLMNGKKNVYLTAFIMNLFLKDFALYCTYKQSDNPYPFHSAKCGKRKTNNINRFFVHVVQQAHE
jgi:hypothetical protein